MIRINNHEITRIEYKNHPILTIYYLGKVVWQAIKSCFGNGYWINNKGWLNQEGWKN